VYVVFLKVQIALGGKIGRRKHEMLKVVEKAYLVLICKGWVGSGSSRLS